MKGGIGVERLTGKWPEGSGRITGRAICEFNHCPEDVGCNECVYGRKNNRLATIEDILGDEYDLDKLRELVKADRDGRCFITPCKLGTKIKTKNGEETVNCFIIGRTNSGEIRMFGPGKANITGDFDEDFPDDDMKSAEIWYVRIDEE